MADIRRKVKAGFKKASTWGTAVALGASDGLWILSRSGIKNTEPLEVRRTVHASAFPRYVHLGRYAPVDFDIELEAQYQGLDVLMAMLFGIAGTPVQQGLTTAYKHTFQLAEDLTGLFGTYAETYGTKILEVPSAKPHLFELTKGDLGIMKARFSLRGNKVIDDSAVNTTTTIANLTYPETEQHIKISQGNVKMNDQSGAALADADKLADLQNFTLRIQRAPTAPELFGSDAISQPKKETDFIIVELILDFHELNSVQEGLLAKKRAKTAQKAEIYFEGATIADTYKYYWKFSFPQLYIIDPDPQYEELFRYSIILRATEAIIAPTGMTGITKPVHFEEINKRSTDALA